MGTQVNDMFANIRHVLGKLSLIVFALGASAATSTSWAMGTQGQLRLEGEVVRAKLEREGQDQIYRLEVKLRFTNIGEKPLILLLGAYGEKRDWWVLDALLSRSLKDALDGKPFFISPTGPANSQSLPLWEEMRKHLRTLDPPPAFTRIIRPHETFLREIETMVIIRDTDSVAPQSRVWLRLLLEMWPSNIEPTKPGDRGQTFGESLRRRWQASGDLWLEPIFSSPIAFDLPATSLP